MRFRTSRWEVNAREEFHRHFGVVASEDDAFEVVLE